MLIVKKTVRDNNLRNRALNFSFNFIIKVPGIILKAPGKVRENENPNSLYTLLPEKYMYMWMQK